MSNSFHFKEKQYKVGDTIAVNYKLKEGDKERLQLFKGIIIKVKGATEATRMITVRKVTKSAIGVERIIPLHSPYIESIELVKQSNYTKAKLYFIRNLSEQLLKSKLYHTKKAVVSKSKTVKKVKKETSKPKESK